MSTAAAPTTAALAASQTAAVRQTLENLAGELGLEVPRFEGSRDGAAVATVVVVGEPKNGKSTLVNALVGRAGLSPVDYAVATATYIAISYGSPGARVYPAGEDLPEEIHLDELASWTSVAGLATNPRASRVARPVEVTIPVPLLEHVSLIDTPGVGGFDGRHDRATVAALHGATTLLFCADASRPLSEPELRFLTEATASIAHVMFALAKVDENGSWREVLEANRQAIADRAPQFKNAPWFPVAAPLAEQALQPALSETAAQTLRERSGVDALAAHLVRETAGRARILEA
ncbi:MAG: dynamin family protein, partial [Deltaproteobacteria bacterium]|nr:dynamin family protein [Deltaproteobacteria bacterium]